MASVFLSLRPKIQAFLSESEVRVDGASVAVIRIALGLLIVYDALRKGPGYFRRGEDALFQFPFAGFDWVPTAGDVAPVATVIWAVSGLFLALGLWHRLAAITAAIMAGWGFVLAEEYYLNHYYLLMIICGLMACVPAANSWAVNSHSAPMRKRHLWLLKGQVEIVLLYAGIVKINADWLTLEPIRSWLLERKNETFFSPLFDYEATFYLAAHGSILLHIIGAPLLFFKATQLPVFMLYCVFHLTNHHMFNIGIFPWMTIALTTIFFAPSWPRRWLGNARTMQRRSVRDESMKSAALLFNSFAVLWLAFQTLFPLRHYLHEGDVAWTYQGHTFAWRMKLVDRDVDGFVLAAYAPEKDLIYIPDVASLLTRRQLYDVLDKPHLIHSFAHQLKRHLETHEMVKIERMHVLAPVSVNGRPFRPLLYPSINLLDRDNIRDLKHWVAIGAMTESAAPQSKRVPWAGDIFQALQKMGLPLPQKCRATDAGWYECQVVRNAEDRQYVASAN